MGLEPLDQQVVDSSKVVVAFVLQRLWDEWQREGETTCLSKFCFYDQTLSQET